jgi:hypothetical protein
MNASSVKMDASSVKARVPGAQHVEGRDAERQEISASRIKDRGVPRANMAHVETARRTQTMFDEEDSSRAQAGRRAREEEAGRANSKEAGRANSADIAPARRSKTVDELSTRALSTRELSTRARVKDFSMPKAAHRAATPHHRPADSAPALTDEKTANEAASVRPSTWAQGQSSENPWPDLPLAQTSDPLDEVGAFESELRRSQRLEREQRGMWWNA